MTLTGLIQFWQPQFAGAQWQIYLIYVASAAVTRQSPLGIQNKCVLTRSPFDSLPSFRHAKEDILDRPSNTIPLGAGLRSFLDRYLFDAPVHATWKLRHSG